MSRRMVVVDCESTSLDLSVARAVEVAWWDLESDERATFIPPHNVAAVLRFADPESLRITGYRERIADAQQGSWGDVIRLHDRLAGVTLAGSNPRYAAALIEQLFGGAPVRSYGQREISHAPWHHRLWDLAPYAAGVLGLDELPGLATVCELLDVDAPDHTAEGDVTATGTCFRKLAALAADLRPATSGGRS